MPTEHPQSHQDVYRLGEPMHAALVRLPLQDRALIDQVGGVFPERAHDFGGFTRVLDIACGSGTWAVRVAYENPRAEVVGIEDHRALVDYASALAQAQGVDNAHFLLWTDAMTRLPFPDQHFDLVHAHFLFSLLHAQEWPVFVQECLRLTRPGGLACLIEPEWGLTNSPPLEQLGLLFLRALKQVGHSLSPDGRHLGVVPLLPLWLQQAGATQITRRAFVLDYFLTSSLARNPAFQVELITQSLRPLILSQGIATPQEVAQVQQQATLDVGREDFGSVVFVLSVCGRKPEAPA